MNWMGKRIWYGRVAVVALSAGIVIGATWDDLASLEGELPESFPAALVEPPTTDPSGLIGPIKLAESERQLPKPNSRATSKPHGVQICASGCALSHHPTPTLSRKRFDELIREYQRQPYDQASACLDELIFYGTQIASLLDRDNSADQQHREFLLAEIARTTLVVELRVIDEFGDVRVYLPPTSVPQHIRQEFSMDVHDFQPAVTSGTVKRVGLNYAWQRL